MVTENLKKVEKKIESACTRAGRDRNDVTLIAVSKTKPVEMMREAMQCGIVTFGENKVQEIVEKQKELTEPLDWHMIGHLQRNKVKQVVGRVKRIHSVDSIRLAKQIQLESEKRNITSDILIEVNMAKEESKYGFMPEEVEDEIIDLLGCKREDIIRASGKTGMGVEEILQAVVERIPCPVGDEEAPLQALIFDSVFNSFRGIIAYFKVVNGVIRTGDKVKFFNTGKEYDADEVGVLKMDMVPRKELRTGDVGYIISGIKTSKEVKVGDTITHISRPCDKAIDGFEEVKPMVFAGVYPIEAEDYENLRASLEKLQLNDASLTFQPESSLALGFGFRCGFLGLLHMEIVQERLDREFDMNVITTVPNVSYMVYDKQGNVQEVHNPGGMPDPTLIDHIEEPYIDASIITATDYIGSIMTLCLGKRGELVRQDYISGNRVELHYKMPLGEIVIDFYDKLKSISKGYASFDYHQSGFRPSKLVKLDILLNGESVDALSTLTHFDNAYDLGRRMCEKLKELIPRQQFEIAIQAAIGAKIIARETIKAVRKDVTAKCYGGDVSRKRKLLEKQKKGKKRMKQIGTVEVPQKAFLAVLKLD